MKAVAHKELPQGFAPVTVTLTFESQEEVNALYRIVNGGEDALLSACNGYTRFPGVKAVTSRDLAKVASPIYSALQPFAR